tara:strand:+ start:2221 stop:2904 length:684 start_codon:yes stop_codon:yes gene_type:complete
MNNLSFINFKTHSMPHFIGAWQSDDNKYCDDLIKYFSDNPMQLTDGKVFDGNDFKVNKDKLDSKNLSIKPNTILEDNSLFTNYMSIIVSCIKSYQSRYPYIPNFNDIGFVEELTLTKNNPVKSYEPMVSFARNQSGNSIRVFSFLTFLNSIDDGGIEFINYNTAIKPIKGLTVLWPSEWSHGYQNLPPTKSRYTISGFIGFTNIRKKDETVKIGRSINELMENYKLE